MKKTWEKRKESLCVITDPLNKHYLEEAQATSNVGFSHLITYKDKTQDWLLPQAFSHFAEYKGVYGRILSFRNGCLNLELEKKTALRGHATASFTNVDVNLIVWK